MLARVRQGFDSANSPYGLRNHQRTAVTGDALIRQRKHPLGTHKSSRNCCHGRHTDWTAQNPPRDSQLINELLARVTHGFDIANTPYGLINHQRTAGTGDTGIRQRKKPLRTQKSTTNCCHGRRTDSTAQTPPRDSQIIKELLARVTHRFDSAKQQLGTHKS
jgi:hypothetical protein